MNKKTMNFYSYKLLGLLSLTLLSQPASADLFKCNACPAGYKCDGNTQYACPVGTYSNAGAASCTNCPAGQYQDKTAQSSCKSCPAGMYTNSDKSACVNKCTVSAVNYRTSYIYSSGCGCVNQGSGGPCMSLQSSCQCSVKSETKTISAGQKAGTTISISTWIYSGSMSASKDNSYSGSNCCVSCSSKGNYKGCSQITLVYDSSTNKIKFQCAGTTTVLATVDAKDC